jgi:macrodomain Ter protein organizer (MatP/YcbG family)
MPKTHSHKRTLDVDTSRWERLKLIAEHQGRPVTELVQEGIDVVLDLGEKQMNTLERAIAKAEES